MQPLPQSSAMQETLIPWYAAAYHQNSDGVVAAAVAAAVAVAPPVAAAVAVAPPAAAAAVASAVATPLP